MKPPSRREVAEYILFERITGAKAGTLIGFLLTLMALAVLTYAVED